MEQEEIIIQSENRSKSILILAIIVMVLEFLIPNLIYWAIRK